ncbi:MAG: hypothetical protein Q4G44_04460 [Alcaligenaceae bacterium]|nr:hypothetical protein [Alcaligenaceae bacterium]
MQTALWQVAQIYLDTRDVAADLLPLKIAGNEVRFLRSSLLDDCQFMTDQSGNWHLRFFVGTEFEQKLFVRFTNADDVITIKTRLKRTPGPNLNYLTMLVFSVGADDPEFIESRVAGASSILKDSLAIRDGHLIRTDYHSGYVDGRGEIYLSSHDPDINFQRHILLHALAQAYMQVMSQLKHRLRPGLIGQGDIRVLRAVYQDFVHFNAHFFFLQPALYSRPAMCEAWQRIDEAYRVCAENRELFEKIKSVHFLLDLENSEKEAAHRESSNAKMNQLNITIAVVGVLIALSTWLIEYLGS